MSEPLTDQILKKLRQAAELYHRLILVVASPGAGKTTALQNVRDCKDLPLISLNLELCCRMLDLTERQRALKLPILLREIIGNYDRKIILLDNIEIIFDVGLKQDPLRLLQGLSRDKTLVAAWSGTIDKGSLTYATSDHPEYRRYPIHDFLVASPEVMI